MELHLLSKLVSPGIQVTDLVFFLIRSLIPHRKNLWLVAWSMCRVGVCAGWLCLPNNNILTSKWRSIWSLPACRTKFIAWCLRRPKKRMPTGSRVFAPAAHVSRFVLAPNIKRPYVIFWRGGMSDKSELLLDTSAWQVYSLSSSFRLNNTISVSDGTQCRISGSYNVV